MDTFVDGQTGNLTEVVIRVSADGTNTVGRERNAVRELAVYLKESDSLQIRVITGKRGGIHVARVIAAFQPAHTLFGGAVRERLWL